MNATRSKRNVIQCLPNGIPLSAINPDRDPRYSLGLYRWLRNYYSTHPERYWPAISGFRDKKGRLYIGHYHDDGWFSGVPENRLTHVFINKYKGEMFAYSPKDWGKFTPIPDFWDQYVAIGSCFLDHYSHTWQMCDGGETRECRYCNAKQSLHRWAETIQREEWRDAA